MADFKKPLLIFPKPESVNIPKRHGFGSEFPVPSRNKRGRESRIKNFIESAISNINDVSGDPQLVLVIETVGNPADFHRAVRVIDGLEWLGEIDTDDVPVDDLYDKDTNKERARKKGGKLYLSSSNQQALKKILRLYKEYQNTGAVEHGFGEWKKLFQYISDLRCWNERDCLESTGILSFLKEEIKAKRGTSSRINFDILLHFISDEDKAQNKMDELIENIKKVKGAIGKQYRQNGIAFHAVKVTLPVDQAEKLYNAYYSRDNKDVGYPKWMNTSIIRYCRPIGAQILSDEPTIQSAKDMETNLPGDFPPIVALLDGVPLIQHKVLRDFIHFDDPDDFSSKYEVREQKHGTGMASLICHGDLLDSSRQSIKRKIYMRPVMFPEQINRIEKISEKEFAEDIIERAIVNLFDGQSPVMPSVRVVNLSLGNVNEPFFKEMSPWAKLLDWLSWKYKVLFVVSSGNYSKKIYIDKDNSQTPLSDKFIRKIENEKSKRTLLSPAESINSLTVGAIHRDYSNIGASGMIDPYEGHILPAEYSRNGAGYREQIKPEILVSGGRMLYRKENNEDKETYTQIPDSGVGQQTAYVGAIDGDIKNTKMCAGTSNAAALTSHAAAHLYEIIEDLRQENSGELPEEYDALILKSLLVHGASWGDAHQKYETIINRQNSRNKKRVFAKYLGYGMADFNRVMSCTEKRVTLIGYGDINEKERHRFSLKIPNEFKEMHLRLIATLAWFTPINPVRYGIREAKLFFEMPELSSGNRKEATYHQVKKGTVQHEILDIKRFDKDDINIYVQCDKDATEALGVSIPYAISFTIEAVQDIRVDIYELIQQSIKISP